MQRSLWTKRGRGGRKTEHSWMGWGLGTEKWSLTRVDLETQIQTQTQDAEAVMDTAEHAHTCGSPYCTSVHWPLHLALHRALSDRASGCHWRHSARVTSARHGAASRRPAEGPQGTCGRGRPSWTETLGVGPSLHYIIPKVKARLCKSCSISARVNDSGTSTVLPGLSSTCLRAS